MKILIADDEQIIRKGLAKMIKDLLPEHVICGEAANGYEVLELVVKCIPDLILMDIKMPRMGGLEITQKVKAMYPDIAIIVVSGYGDFEYTSQFIESNVSGYLLKPIVPGKFISAVQKAEKLFREKEHAIFVQSKLINEFTKLSEDVPKEIGDKIIEILKTEIKSVSGNDFLVKNAIEYISNCFYQKISLSNIAQHLFVSAEHLCRIFHQSTGMTVSTYLNTYRIYRAKQLLIYSPQSSISDIATAVGFTAPKYFSKMFKSFTGINPKEYRNRVSDSFLILENEELEDVKKD